MAGFRSHRNFSRSGEVLKVLPKTIESILGDLKPEAAYFAEENGKRTGFIFFDLKDTSQTPAVADGLQCAYRVASGHEPRRPEESHTGHREGS